jgi:hypothetical protein
VEGVAVEGGTIGGNGTESICKSRNSSCVAGSANTIS